jgi:transcriptional regulator with XRE-family HTH domain
MVMNEKIFFTRCTELFQRSGMTVAELAKTAGLQYHTVRNYVKGNTLPRPKHRRQLATALGTSVSYLFDQPESIEPSENADAFPLATEAISKAIPPASSAAAIHREVGKLVEGIATEVSGGTLAVRDVWFDDGLWPVQSNLGVFSQAGCIAVLHTVTFQGDYADLGPTKEIAALRMNLIAGNHAQPHQADCGVIVSLVIDGRALSAERMAEQMYFFGRQIDALLATKVIVAGVVNTLYDDREGLQQALRNIGSPANTLEVRLNHYFANSLVRA